MRSLRGRLPLLIGLFAVLPKTARASNVTEIPDNGSEQMGRGGAWVARASDPLATYFNPAGLAGQRTALTLQANLVFQNTCFSRVKAANDTTFGSSDTLLRPDGTYPEVCSEGGPSIGPQIGGTLRVTSRFSLGLLFIAPSAAGDRRFPSFVNDPSGVPQPSPNRYLQLQQGGIIATPTLGAAYVVNDVLRLGASVSWGFAKIKLSTAALAVNTDNSNAANDVFAKFQVADHFVPAVQLGSLITPTNDLDVGLWYKWSDSIRARGDVGTAANYFSPQAGRGDTSGIRHADTIFEDCGTGLPTNVCKQGSNGRLTLPVPMEAKVGIRYHAPRNPESHVTRDRRVRDPLTQDRWDLEADVTWANNSALDKISVRFPGDATGRGLLPSAVQGGEIPPNADQVRDYKDVVGLRAGGDYVVLPARLALRGGAFFESSAANPRYQNIDFAASSRFGLSLGGSYRIRTGAREDSGTLEILVAYGHVFFAEQSRTGPNASGTNGIAGTSCNASAPASPSRCEDGSERYRTKWPVNLGTITNVANLVNVGLAYRF